MWGNFFRRSRDGRFAGCRRAFVGAIYFSAEKKICNPTGVTEGPAGRGIVILDKDTGGGPPRVGTEYNRK